MATDISIWVHGPEFGSSVIQVPIVEYLWKKKPRLKIDFNVIEKNRGLVESYFSDEIRKNLSSVEDIKLVHQLVYKKSMDLNISGTSAVIMKNFFKNSLPLYSQFKRRVYEREVKLVVSAGLGEVGVLPKIIRKEKPKLIYLFNYLLEHIDFYKSRFMNKVARKWFIKHYGNFDKTIIQTFFPERDYKIKKELKNLELVNIIARSLTKPKQRIRKELKVKNGEKLVFLALGGAKFFSRIVDAAKVISKEHPDIRFLLLPRSPEEILEFRSKEGFVVPEKIGYNTQDYVGASDIVISKCGFGTIAEAIKHKTGIISIHLPRHAEVTETEILLKKEGIIKNSINLCDTKEIKKDTYKKIINELNNKDSINAMASIKTDGEKQAARIYLDNLK